MNRHASGGVAVIVGAGAGLGAGLARRFVAGGMEVAIASRDAGRARHLAEQTGSHGYACDATDEASVDQFFRQVAGELGEPGLVVYNASGFLRKSVLDIGPTNSRTSGAPPAWAASSLGARALAAWSPTAAAR